MDEAEIIKNQTILNKIINQLNNEIKLTDNKINQQKINIEFQKRQLIIITDQVVLYESQINDIKNQLNDIELNNVRLNKEKLDLQQQVRELQYEIEKTRFRIMEQSSTTTIQLGIFGEMKDPISELIRVLFDNLNNCNDRVDQTFKEISKKSDVINELDHQIVHYQNQQRELQLKIDKLNQDSDECNKQITQLGIDKTNTENFKISLEMFKTKAQIILDNCIVGKDLLEFGINSISDIVNQVKECYNQNGLKLLAF